ncbi:cyclodeaminase/cyclohydrolase family protein [Microbacterium sp. 1P06AB]|uniref:cyclodeaminase/cyclohydrolase family protein n=1 Tax=Microbacterium sp. 1P06AB TaxID=3132289 RepID=UPI0039A67C92
MASDDIDPAETPVAEWVDRLAQAKGAPGGGAACGVMTGIAAGLLGMVAAYTADDPDARQAEQRLSRTRRLALGAAEEDGVRSAAFGAALAMDQGPERERAVRAATIDAVASAVDVGRVAASLLDEVRLLADIGNPHVEADLRVAVEALRAALEGTDHTARADLDLLSRHRAPDDDLDPQVADVERDLVDLAGARAECNRIVAGWSSE